MKPCRWPTTHILNPAFTYVPAAGQTIDHLRKLFARSRARLEAERKANEVEVVEKVRRLK